MNPKTFQLAESLVNPSYVRLGENSLNKRANIMKDLLAQRQLPSEPLDELTVRYFLDSLALMDSNNFEQKVGVGERESRIFSRLVEERHFHMGHGIGRSGDVSANQPKAAGSSLLLQMARFLTTSALHQLNYNFVDQVLLLPFATGMSLSLVLLTLAEMQPARKYVLWSRIDQKTCLKAVETANLVPVVVELRREKDWLCTDLGQMQAKIAELGRENILAILSTTSCFAPRVPDAVEEISLMAKRCGFFHVVNNAYGVWCSKIANALKEASRVGECTVVVQSTDKNFLVPVGGSIIFAKEKSLLESISGKYPGRASGSPIVDMFVTLLSMGKSTLLVLKKERKDNFQHMKSLALRFAKSHNFRLLETPANSFSIAMSLQNLQMLGDEVTRLGSILYSKRVMGHRIVVQTPKETKIGRNVFINYGSHSNEYPFLPYMTFACAVGTKREEIDLFFKRLEESLKELVKVSEKEKNKKIEEVVSSREPSTVGRPYDLSDEKQDIQKGREQLEQVQLQAKDSSQRLQTSSKPAESSNPVASLLPEQPDNPSQANPAQKNSQYTPGVLDKQQ